MMHGLLDANAKRGKSGPETIEAGATKGKEAAAQLPRDDQEEEARCMLLKDYNSN